MDIKNKLEYTPVNHGTSNRIICLCVEDVGVSLLRKIPGDGNKHPATEFGGWIESGRDYCLSLKPDFWQCICIVGKFLEKLLEEIGTVLLDSQRIGQLPLPRGLVPRGVQSILSLFFLNPFRCQ